jgi:hypothetical protein
LVGGVLGVVWARPFAAPRTITTTIAHLSDSRENPIEHRRTGEQCSLNRRIRVTLELLLGDSRSGKPQKLFSLGAQPSFSMVSKPPVSIANFAGLSSYQNSALIPSAKSRNLHRSADHELKRPMQLQRSARALPGWAIIGSVAAFSRSGAAGPILDCEPRQSSGSGGASPALDDRYRRRDSLYRAERVSTRPPASNQPESPPFKENTFKYPSFWRLSAAKAP